MVVGEERARGEAVGKYVHGKTGGGNTPKLQASENEGPGGLEGEVIWSTCTWLGRLVIVDVHHDRGRVPRQGHRDNTISTRLISSQV